MATTAIHGHTNGRHATTSQPGTLQNVGETERWASTLGGGLLALYGLSRMSSPGGRGTRVTVILKYDPPAGKLGATFAQWFGQDPEWQIEEDLRRFKQLMETGEMATSYTPATERITWPNR